MLFVRADARPQTPEVEALAARPRLLDRRSGGGWQSSRSIPRRISALGVGLAAAQTDPAPAPDAGATMAAPAAGDSAMKKMPKKHMSMKKKMMKKHTM